MNKKSFCENWNYGILDGEKRFPVTLPHDAMLSESRSADNVSGANVSWFTGNDYVYEKSFQKIEAETAVLEFEGVYRHAEVFLNDEKVAFRPYGYTNFYVDITSLQKDGENKLRVIARNADQPNSRWYSGAGIYRPVWLYTGAEKHIEINGLKVKTISYAPAIVEITVSTNAHGQVKVTVYDTNGKEILSDFTDSDGRVSFTKEIKNAKLWTAETPNLYVCKAEFEGDIETVNFGIRTITCTSADGFCVNDERVILRGACIHSDNGVLGAVVHPFAEERKVRLLKENGYNAVRCAHNPCSKAFLDACDKLGMYVLDEYVDMWYIHKTKYDYALYFEEWWQQDLTDMVEKDFSHPSVIMYSLGNEVSETSQKKGIDMCREMTAFLKERDNRPVTCGINIFFNFLFSLGLGVYSDKKADAEIKKKKKHKAVGSEFFNNIAGIVGANFMKFGATLHGSDVKTREAFSALDVAGYNYGIRRYKKDLKKYPQRAILGTETFCKDAWFFWKTANENPAIIGDFVWAGIDYLGESGIGAWEYKEYAPDFSHSAGWMTAGSGRIDLTGKPNGEAAYKRVVYGLDDINVAVVPVGFKNHSPSAWKMTNAIVSWSWTGKEGETACVEVYGYGDTVTLYLNDKKIAHKKCSKTARTIFKGIKYQNGELKAVITRKNNDALQKTLKTAGADTVLKAEAENAKLTQADLAYIRVRFTDLDGETKPLLRGELSIEVKNGKLLGFGNGCSFNARGYLTDKTDTYFGEALAVVQPVKVGKIDVKVSCEDKVATTSVEIV